MDTGENKLPISNIFNSLNNKINKNITTYP